MLLCRILLKYWVFFVYWLIIIFVLRMFLCRRCIVRDIWSCVESWIKLCSLIVFLRKRWIVWLIFLLMKFFVIFIVSCIWLIRWNRWSFMYCCKVCCLFFNCFWLRLWLKLNVEWFVKWNWKIFLLIFFYLLFILLLWSCFIVGFWILIKIIIDNCCVNVNKLLNNYFLIEYVN